jgi:hypothetical protein
LLKHLLLRGGIEVLQSMSIWVRTRRHTAHEGRVYLCSGSRDHRSSELMRHSPRSALLTWVVRHATRSHGVAGDTWMPHASRMPREIWAHTCCHHD